MEPNQPELFLQIEAIDQQKESKFIKESVVPYFKELYRDLLSRETQPKAPGVSKYVFQEVRA